MRLEFTRKVSQLTFCVLFEVFEVIADIILKNGEILVRKVFIRIFLLGGRFTIFCNSGNVVVWLYLILKIQKLEFESCAKILFLILKNESNFRS